MTVCGNCKQAITKRRPGIICYGFCRDHYHANGICSDVTKMQLSVLESLPGAGWRCTSCRTRASSRDSVRLSTMNLSTTSPGPDRSSRNGRVEAVSGVGSPRDEVDCNDDISIQADALTTISRLTLEIRSLRESVNFCSDKISDFETKIAKFGEVMARVPRLEKENESLRKEVSVLSSKIDNIEQHNRSNNIEIQNVPENTGENLLQLISKIGSHVGCPVESSSLDYITRVPTHVSDKPKNIVARFVSKIKRDNFLAAYKAKRLSNREKRAGLSIADVSERLYVGEHLTMNNKLLHKEARKVAREKDYKYVWTQNGKILIRKADNSRIIYINNVSDLNKL